MGATYVATDSATGQNVVVKELLQSNQSPDEKDMAIRNFLAELAVLKSIRHPQIPRILDHFVEDRRFFFTMEYIPGKDFSTILADSGRVGLPEDMVVRVGIEVCRILTYLHTVKPYPIIHRDLKPANLMRRDGDERIMLLDFGISKAAKPKEGMMIGTAGYAPPEQHLHQTDPRSDIYSLGATLHELATGLTPLPENEFIFAFPSEIRPELSHEFSDTIIKSLYFEPDDRYPSALKFEEALERLLPEKLPPVPLDHFVEAVERLGKEFLTPALHHLKREYGSECQTDHVGNDFTHMTFTLGTHIPFELIIQAKPEKHHLTFFVREGLLPPTLIGEIDPTNENAHEKIHGILHLYTARYEAIR